MKYVKASDDFLFQLSMHLFLFPHETYRPPHEKMCAQRSVRSVCDESLRYHPEETLGPTWSTEDSDTQAVSSFHWMQIYKGTLSYVGDQSTKQRVIQPAHLHILVSLVLPRLLTVSNYSVSGSWKADDRQSAQALSDLHGVDYAFFPRHGSQVQQKILFSNRMPSVELYWKGNCPIVSCSALLKRIVFVNV